MKKLIAILTLAATSSAFGIITPITETSDYVKLEFKLRDNALSAPDTETYTFINGFPGTSVTFTFDDRISKKLWGRGNLEEFSTIPFSMGSYSFNQDTGDLDFGGSFSSGSKLIEWAIDSKVKTRFLKNDYWKGTFTAKASSVPDGGATLGLLGAAFAGMVFIKRRKLANKS